MSLSDLIKDWSRTMSLTGVKAQPLSSQSAYSLSSIGKNKTMEELQELLIDNILDNIQKQTTFGKYHTIVEFEPWVTAEQKEIIMNNLKELSYKILYNDSDIILISWKIN